MMGVLFALITGILVSSGERELEIPELVVTGRYEGSQPVRSMWPVPEVQTGYIIEDYKLPMPAHSIARSYHRSHNPSDRPPSHVSVSLSGGPDAAYLLMNISEPRGGLSFTGWSEPGERLDRMGLRALLFSRGEWGRIMASGERWEDRLDDHKVASGWAAGDISLMFPRGKLQSVSLGAFSTSGDDDIHFEAGYSRRLHPTRVMLSLDVSDRQASGLFALRTADHRLQLTGGVSLLHMDEYEKTWFVGSGDVCIVSNPDLSIVLTGERSMGIATRRYLRLQFPLASTEQAALPEAVEWDVTLESTFRIAPRLRVSLRGGIEQLAQAIGWRELPESKRWRAESFSGEGRFGTIQTNWAPSNRLEITGRLTTKNYQLEAPVELNQTDDWPLVPKLQWFVGLSTMGRFNTRLGMYGIYGMKTVENEDLDDSLALQWDIGYRLRKGLRLWSSGSVGSGWDLSPVPTRTVTLGLAWSLYELSHEWHRTEY